MKMESKQLEIIGHCLGINVYHARLSKKKKDKKLPKEFYRNYFCADSERHSDYPIFAELYNLGYLEKWHKDKMLFFGVTDKGIEVFKNEFTKQITQQVINVKEALSDIY